MDIETDRLILRKFEKRDLEDVYAFGKEPGGPEAAGFSHFLSIAEAEAALKGYLQEPLRLALERKSDGRVLGYIVIKEDSEEHRADTKELGYLIGPPFQREGYMREALDAVFRYLFTQDIAFVYACCFQDNVPSKALIERLGLVFEKEGTFLIKHCGVEVKTFEYVMTKDHFDELNR